MKKIVDLGFKKIGVWKKDEKGIFWNLKNFKEMRDVVFAFVSNQEIVYIGVTEIELKTFLQEFIEPLDIDLEKITIKNLLLEELVNNEVDIFVLKNRKFFGLMKKFTLVQINELIERVNPLWNSYNLKNRMKNIVGKDRIDLIHSEKLKQKLKQEELENEIAEKEKIEEEGLEIQEKSKGKKKNETYFFILGKSYYERGFFNLKTSYSNLVGEDKTDIKIILIGKNKEEKIIPAKINRTANSSKTARIVGNKALKIWFKDNIDINNQLKITFISKKKIKLEVV